VKRFTWIVTIPVTVVVVLFTIGNLNDVSINLWPLPWTIVAPLYLIVLVCLLIGFLVGAIVAWASGGRRRRRNRELADHSARLARQLDELRREQAASQAQLVEVGRSDRPASLPGL
jgi:lipopolysaccharide assembly protein A